MIGSIVVRMLPYLLVGLIIAGGVWKWKSMEATIVEQNARIELQEQKIEVMKHNAEQAAIRAVEERDRAIFEAIAKNKREQIEKRMKRDTSNSVDINSTRYYIIH